jgi:uncharacterized membrane protein
MNLPKMLVIAVSLITLDTLWLHGYLLEPFKAMIENVQKQAMQVRMPGVVIAYLALLAVAIVFIPKTDNYIEAFLLGFCIYAIYDGTNYATLSQWDASVATADSVWGGVLFLLLKAIAVHF